MTIWLTEIFAKDPVDGLYKPFCGPNVPGITFEDAERYCQENGLGYCRVLGKLIETVEPLPDGTLKITNHENLN